jgi:hypothetical protein
MGFGRTVLALFLVAGAFACSDGGDGTDGGTMCPTDPLPDCSVAGAPSFAGEIEPLIELRCASLCHHPGGVAQSKPFTSYDEVYARWPAILRQVYACRMPPPDAGVPALEPSERASLLLWLRCEAPNK